MITTQVEHIGPWVCEKAGGHWVLGRGTGIGKMKDNTLVAGVLYEDYNGANVFCHIRGDGQWADRRFLNIIFDYPFNQLKVNRITVPIRSTNKASIRLVTHMGFELECPLSRAAPDGDILIFRMFKENCKYIRGKYVKV